MDDQQELSYGQKAVGVRFNPSENPWVTTLKKQYAATIDILNEQREASNNPEVKRQLSIAITETQTAQMWAVKAMTWQY